MYFLETLTNEAVDFFKTNTPHGYSISYGQDLCIWCSFTIQQMVYAPIYSLPIDDVYDYAHMWFTKIHFQGLHTS